MSACIADVIRPLNLQWKQVLHEDMGFAPGLAGELLEGDLPQRYRAGKFRTRVMAKGLARTSPFFLVLQSVSRGWLRLSPRAPPSDSVPPVT